MTPASLLSAKNMLPRAAIFDLDGTLLDTLADIADSANKALRELGQPIHDDEAYKQMIGEGADVLARRALRPDQQHLVAHMLDLYKRIYLKHAFDRTRPYPGIGDLLAELALRSVKTAVLTNKPQENTDPVVHHYFPGFPWGAIHGHREGVPKKPDPHPALQIASELGVQPGHCLFIGDSKFDMLTARAAGMIAVGCLWGFRDRNELIDSGAHHLVAEPREILSLL
jgi:phosphoglycolate phosphatase